MAPVALDYASQAGEGTVHNGNGTAWMVKDIYDPGWGTHGSDPEDMVGIGSTLYFSAKGPNHGRHLWRSDGTAAGTVMVKATGQGRLWTR